MVLFNTMLLLILIIVAIVLAAALILLNKMRPAIFAKNALEADAVILNNHLTGICIKNELQAIIQLQVHPERGKSFVSDIKEMVSPTDYPLLQPGAKIRVRYNPRNRKELLIIKESFVNNTHHKRTFSPLA